MINAIIEIFNNFIILGVEVTIFKCRRFFDRGMRLSSDSFTKEKSIQGYVEVHSGPEYALYA
jgi:hypothetical protein